MFVVYLASATAALSAQYQTVTTPSPLSLEWEMPATRSGPNDVAKSAAR